VSARERHEPSPLAVEEWVVADQECGDTLLNESRKGALEFTLIARGHNRDLPRARESGGLDIRYLGRCLGAARVG
jgi:hypothetical protein